MSLFSVAFVEATIYDRVRDSDGVAHSDVILDVLSDVQRIVNACYGGVLTDGTLTLTPGQTIYTYNDVATDVIRILDVSCQDRPLRRVDWQQLAHSDPLWMRSRGMPRMWDTCGHNLLFVVPANNETVTVRYIPELVDLTSGGNFELPDRYMPLVEDLTVEVLLLRQRLFPSIEEAAAAATRHLRPRMVP